MRGESVCFCAYLPAKLIGLQVKHNGVLHEITDGIACIPFDFHIPVGAIQFGLIAQLPNGIDANDLPLLHHNLILFDQSQQVAQYSGRISAHFVIVTACRCRNFE